MTIKHIIIYSFKINLKKISSKSVNSHGSSVHDRLTANNRVHFNQFFGCVVIMSLQTLFMNEINEIFLTIFIHTLNLNEKRHKRSTFPNEILRQNQHSICPETSSSAMFSGSNGQDYIGLVANLIALVLNINNSLNNNNNNNNANTNNNLDNNNANVALSSNNVNQVS